MTESSRLEKMKFARRSILSGAVMLGGGAALSAAIPTIMLTAADAAEESASEQDFHPTTASASQNVVENATEAKFSTEFLSNKVFKDLALNFDSPSPVSIDGKPAVTGALMQPNGDCRFLIYAPKAKDVRLKLNPPHDSELILTKREDGVFEGLLRYDDNNTGPKNVDVYVDGMIFLDQYIPIHWTGNRPYNFIEVPDTEMEFMFINDVPHGAISREIYWADALKSWERCTVYTPAGYMKSTKEYPVLYLQHGGGDNEVEWERIGRVAHILDNLFAEGKAEPFIVVMNNDMLRYSSTDGGVIDDAFERMLTESCIPYIEKNYRVKTGKWNRAIGGLSMGAYMSCDIGFKHHDLFGYMGTFTASMTSGANVQTSYDRPYSVVMKDSKRFAQNLKVYFRSTTPQEDHFEFFTADDKICADAGIDKFPSYHRIVYPKRTSKWNSWRMGLRDYTQLLFRST